MHPKLKAELHRKIEEFVNENCEEEEWAEYDNVWYPPEMQRLMTDAAEVVFDSIIATSRYAMQEGFD